MFLRSLSVENCISKNFKVLSVAAVMLVGVTSGAEAADLGVAQNYNAFILGNALNLNNQSQGRLAIGGTLNASSYTVNNSNLPTSATLPALVVGGNVTYNNGQVKGNAIIGGTLTGNVTVTGGVTQNAATLPVNFSSASSFYAAYTIQLANLAVNSTTAFAFGGLTLTGTSTGLNVFNVNFADLSASNNINFVTPDTSTVLVNVIGTSGTFASPSGAGIALNGQDRTKILYNFATASTITSQNIAIEGSVLAPLATYTFTNGQLNGTLITANFQGANGSTGTLNNYAFTGNLPTAVPEPSSLLGVLIFGAMGILKRAQLAAKS